MHIRNTLSRLVLRSVNIQLQCMGITPRFHAKRFYLNRTHPVVLQLNKRTKDKMSKYDLYRMSQEEWTKLRESVPYVELY